VKAAFQILVLLLAGFAGIAGAATTSTVDSSPAAAENDSAAAQAFQVHSSISPTSASVGDRFTWHVAVDAPELSRVSIKEPFTKAGDESGSWTLVSRSEPKDTEGAKGVHTRSIDYVLTNFDTGVTSSPQAAVSYSPPNNAPELVKFSSVVPVHINSLLTSGTMEIQAATPPVSLPIPLAFKISVLVLVGLVLLLIAYLLWRKFGRHISNMMSGALSPEQAALLELERIEKDRLIDQKKFREFYTRLSDAVRGYVGDAMNVKSRDLTSYELLSSLTRKADEQPAADEQRYNDMLTRLDGLLEEADLVKFARATPDVSRCRTSLSRGREIVELLKYRFEPAKDENGAPEPDPGRPPKPKVGVPRV
jgi:hypothetical protein